MFEQIAVLLVAGAISAMLGHAAGYARAERVYSKRLVAERLDFSAKYKEATGLPFVPDPDWNG